MCATAGGGIPRVPVTDSGLPHLVHFAMRISAVAALPLIILALGCRHEGTPVDDDTISGSPVGATAAGDGSQLAAAVQAKFLSDSLGTELQGQLFVQVLSPGTDEETPLANQELPSPSAPGPHTLEGVLHADLRVLRQLFGSGDELRVEADRVHFPGAGVTLAGHRHGEALYVPVRLFARQYSAYARIWGPLATSGVIWPREILEFWKEHGPGGAPALLEAEAEGLISGIHHSPKPGQN
jgi:hypothetical protein